jgi:hypothetical protein
MNSSETSLKLHKNPLFPEGTLQPSPPPKIRIPSNSSNQRTQRTSRYEDDFDTGIQLQLCFLRTAMTIIGIAIVSLVVWAIVMITS